MTVHALLASSLASICVCFTSFVTSLYIMVRYFLGKPVSFLVKVAAGLVWSIGNMGSTYATLHLGNTIGKKGLRVIVTVAGFPLVQAQVIISGLWGVAEMWCILHGR